MLFLLVTPV